MWLSAACCWMLAMGVLGSAAASAAAEAEAESDAPYHLARNCSFTQLITMPGVARFSQRVFMDGKRMRVENYVDGRTEAKTVLVADAATGKAFILFPEQQKYLAISSAAARQESALPPQAGKWRRVGEETVDDIPCDVYVAHTTEGPVRVWIGRDLAVPHKIVRGSLVSIWTDYTEGAATPEMFTLPSEYEQISDEDLGRIQSMLK